MKKQISLIVAVSHLIFVSGCATAPDKISAAYVSPMQYNSFDCEQMQFEMQRLSNKVREIAGIQKSEASKDAWALGIGLVLFWPSLFFMIGGDKKEELARLKGEYEAVEQAATYKKCNFMAEVEAARAEALASEDAKTSDKKTIKESTTNTSNFTAKK